MSQINRDGMEDTVKESENKPPEFTLEYSLDDLFDLRISGEEIELTRISTIQQLKIIKTSL